jgi:hypothetical protein
MLLTTGVDEHWEKKTFTELDDPEYSVGPSGRLEWTVTNYNGTKENPNRELVMKSPIVNIGGYDWQIKFYPKGNDSDYLSIYLECVTVIPKKEESPPTASEVKPGEENSKATSEEAAKPEKEKTEKTVVVEEEIPLEEQRLPIIPLLDAKPQRKRPSVAAQASVVLYNPAEPRVNYFRSCLHRFCPSSPDWGWTRFHGPYYEIQHRQRGQRQALLRNDTLAFTAYIRLVEDSTGCLWEHDTRENPWNSFAMTGLQGLSVPDHLPGGNVISAVASWLLLKPFREFLYAADTPDYTQQTSRRPTPLLRAFQKVLYAMRTPEPSCSGPISLEDMLDALVWYGIDHQIEKKDVVEIWDLFRIKISEEITGSELEQRFLRLLGPIRDFATGIPSYRVPAQGIGSVQEAVQKSPHLTSNVHSHPDILTIELERQIFDKEKRDWKKLVGKVTLDDRIDVKGQSYTLYGIVVHKDHLQSKLYRAIMRPEGPDGKWYDFGDGQNESKVVCVTRRSAIEKHEGDDTLKDSNLPVAYIAIYLRDEILDSKGKSRENEEAWDLPAGLKEEIARDRERDVYEPRTSKKEEVKENSGPKEDRVFTCQVWSSQAFLEHEGPGIIDIFDNKWANSKSCLLPNLELKSTYESNDIRKALAEQLGVDPRRCKYWFLDTPQGTEFRPSFFSETLLGKDKWTMSDMMEVSPEARIWLHVIDAKDLPAEPEPAETKEVQGGNAISEDPPTVTASEPIQDTPMSEPDDGPNLDQNVAEAANEQIRNESTENRPVSGVIVADASIPPANITNSEIPAPPDTEMGNTQDAVPPPPPPFNGTNPITPPPPAPLLPPTSDEVYVFLKFFDAEAQTLMPKCSFVCKKSDHIQETILKKLELSEGTPLDLYQEEDLTSVYAITRPRRSFASNDLQTGCIIIATAPLKDETKESLADRGAFADPEAYLVARCLARNFPNSANGHFTHSYFSQQSYTGDFVAHRCHGTGTRIYYSGDVYTGSFRLGARHGHGFMTYQSGDTYEGEWQSDLKHGQGTYTEKASGNSYAGGWQKDKRFGEGVTMWKQAQEMEKLCRVCWEDPAEAAFYDCGHVVACLACARGVDTCPVCRKRVIAPMKIYFT